MTTAIVITILVIGMSTAIGVAIGSYIRRRDLEEECEDLWIALGDTQTAINTYRLAEQARQAQRIAASQAAKAKRDALKEKSL